MDSRYTSKFFTNMENLNETFSKYGVAIIPSLLDDTECKKMISQLWDYFEHVSMKWKVPINRNDSATWKNMQKLWPLKRMLYKYMEVGHAQVCWDLRQKRKIADVFAKIYGVETDELICSFDGFSFLPPPEKSVVDCKIKEWFHVDHAYTKPDFECIQGWVTAENVDEGDGTLVVLTKSHRLHTHVQREFNITDNKNMYELSEKQLNFYLKNNCKVKKITCPKGSLVLWDSRVVHCGMTPDKDRVNMNTRAVAYISYEPRSRMTKAMQRKRIKAFKDLKTTTHWSAKPCITPRLPRWYKKNSEYDITIIPNPVINDFGKKLVGY